MDKFITDLKKITARHKVVLSGHVRIVPIAKIEPNSASLVVADTRASLWRD